MNPAERDATSIETLQFALLGTPTWRSARGQSQRLSRKDAVLVAKLALDGPQARDVLAGSLWPEADQVQASGSLRQRITRLRRDTGHAVVQTGAALRLADGVLFDVADIATMSDEALLAAGELLAGFDYSDNDEVDAWVRMQRQRVWRACADTLAGHAQQHEARGELVAALRLNDRVLALVPIQEHSWRRQMRLHYLRGDRSAAIHAFERFEATLKADTGARPSDETLELLRTIEATRIGPIATRAVMPACLLRPPVLVGRSREWRAMVEAWSAQKAFLLQGDAGMGKSRLLADFLHDRAGVSLEQGRPGDAETPYSLLSRLLRRVVAERAVTLDEFARHELSRIVPEFGMPPIATGQQSALWRAVEAVLESAVSQGLTAVVVDDLHFADLASVEALRWLSASLPLAALRFGLAARPLDDGPLSELLNDWIGDSCRPTPIVLQPLTAVDIDALVASLDLPELGAQASGERLLRHAGGHPFFTLETLKSLIGPHPDSGTDGLPQPASAQTMLARRFSGLSPHALALLRVAAVCGEDLTVERAAALQARSTLDLVDAWAELETAGMLQGLRFVHDLMRETALRLVPEAIRSALHAAVARLLVDETGVPPSRIAEHWQAAGRWADAAIQWHAAGMTARYAGRLVEQQTLLQRAAECHRLAGNPGGQFDAIHDSLDGLLVRSGGAAVLAELQRQLDGLADTPERQIKAELMRVEALLDLTRSVEALSRAAAAAGAARAYPALLADALCRHGAALAQCGRFAEAIAMQQEGLGAARSSGDKAQALRASSALAYVLMQAGQPGRAVEVQHECTQLARELGDNAELALSEGNLATFLGSVGDAPATYRHALQAHKQHEAMGTSVNGTQGGLNLANLGTAAAYLGRFDEALQALAESSRILGDQVSPAAFARTRILFAAVWLTLGQPDAARASLAEIPEGVPPVMQAQWHLLLARAAAMDGLPPSEHLGRTSDVLAAHPEVERLAALWLEWSRHGEAGAVIERLRCVREVCEVQGQHGASRAFAIRQIARSLDLRDAGIADRMATQATELRPWVAEGLHAWMYPPEAWLALSRALARAGGTAEAKACQAAALDWIHTKALPRVPAAHRHSFLTRNPVNRWLLGDA